ncbi:MAG: ABC transporter ATP-binding protein [Eubacteriales bacterium]|nr:ABC transporter ATP-binding protein [Eubacteriales bacterium]
MEIFARIARMCRPHRRHFFWGLTGLVIANITRLILPLLAGSVVDTVIEQGRIERLLPLCGWIFGLTALRACMGFLRGYQMEQLSQNFTFDLRTGLYRHLQQMPYRFYDENYVGEIMSRMTGDIEGLRNLLAGGLVQLFESLIWFFGALIMLFTLNVRLAFIMLIFAPAVAVVAFIFNKKIRPCFRAVREQNAVLSTRTQENISGMRVVKAFAREEHEKQSFNAENRKVLRLHLKVTYTWSDFVPMLDFLGSLCTPALMGVGGYMVVNGQLTLGTLVAFTNYIWLITWPMRNLGGVVNMLAMASTSAEKLFYYIDLGSSIREKEQPSFPQPFAGHVVFDHVTFSYGDGIVLDDVSFEARPGSTIALMGATGSGKTSIINLMARFYDCQRGSVTIDGVNVKDMPLRALRDRIGIVMQETFLFSETLANNIAFGRPDAPLPRIDDAAGAACAQEFIQAMPLGYETIVGERGLGLSGGQKQRVAIARALLYDPTILVLDDATSAVDMETEHAIQLHFEEQFENRTTFIVAHRISSVQKADEILVLDEGRIAERGNHNDLLAKKGIYYRMYLDQYRDFAAMEGQVG